LEGPEKTFWDRHPAAWEKGPVHAARFEKYLSRFSWVGLQILGRKKLMRLFDFNDVEEQKQYFDRQLDSRRLKRIFKIAFHPKIYKKRGMDAQALVHSRERDIAEFFFSRFRSFCTATPARKNYFLQLAFFNRLLFMEALPEYLQENGNQRLRKSVDLLSFYHESLSERIRRKPRGYYDAFALSNIGDWMSKEDFAALLELIGTQAAGQSRALLRYIHFAHPIPVKLAGVFKLDRRLGDELEAVDRYPFYSLLPMRISDEF
jgi:S-adenosylmethionine:diacylglycerol 3-amino-3-carboxypropyl transferase